MLLLFAALAINRNIKQPLTAIAFISAMCLNEGGTTAD